LLEIDPKFPGVEKWVNRIEGREAVQRALKIPEGTMSKEEIGEMFRGLRAKVDAMENSDNFKELTGGSDSALHSEERTGFGLQNDVLT